MNQSGKRTLKMILIIIGSLAVLAALLWGAGYLLFKDFIYPH